MTFFTLAHSQSFTHMQFRHVWVFRVAPMHAMPVYCLQQIVNIVRIKVVYFHTLNCEILITIFQTAPYTHTRSHIKWVKSVKYLHIFNKHFDMWMPQKLHASIECVRGENVERTFKTISFIFCIQILFYVIYFGRWCCRCRRSHCHILRCQWIWERDKRISYQSIIDSICVLSLLLFRNYSRSLSLAYSFRVVVNVCCCCFRCCHCRCVLCSIWNIVYAKHSRMLNGPLVFCSVFGARVFVPLIKIWIVVTYMWLTQFNRCAFSK